jgi:translation elongation factor EF-Ts
MGDKTLKQKIKSFIDPIEAKVSKMLGFDKWGKGVEKNMKRWAKEVNAAKAKRRKEEEGRKGAQVTKGK